MQPEDAPLETDGPTAPGGRNYAGEAPRDRTARRRRQLLDAGLEIFGTTGYRKATVRVICREAKVADRYFYEEFASTEDLLLAVYRECVETLRDTVLEAVAGLDDDVATLAHDGLDAFFACVESDPRLARVVWFEVVGVSSRVEAAYIEQMKAFGEMLVLLLDQKGVRPDMRAEERSVVLLAVVGGVSQVVLNWVNDGFKPARPRLVRPLVGFLLAGTEMRAG
jgi:AcrR family transcriptional regulator